MCLIGILCTYNRNMYLHVIEHNDFKKEINECC